MVKFLIHRPIAVIITYVAFVLTGLVSLLRIPVSLMPDIDIPVISVRINAGDLPARQLENTVVKPIRNVLKEVGDIQKINSETRDGTATVELKFRHGTPIQLASVEVNEKVDKAMSFLPADIQRPEVVRINASDIPVFYLLVHLNDKNPDRITLSGTNPADTIKTSKADEMDLSVSNFCNQVIRKRLEQLPEVAMVDISGLLYPEIRITPNEYLVQSGIFPLSRLEELLLDNHVDPGNMIIKNGQYQYHVRMNSNLQNISGIREIFVNLNGKTVRLDEIAEVTLFAGEQTGNIRINGQNAISLAVIKQPDAQMSDLKKQLSQLVTVFNKDYPGLRFTITRDQSKLLGSSMNNLFQSMVTGGILALLVMFLFLGDYRIPWLIGVSIPVSLIIALLFFYLAGLSINIISLSGLILGVGMMIDNSIIVIDNITQHRNRIQSTAISEKIISRSYPRDSASPDDLTVTDQACISGTNEIIRPLISSVLTTCAVFIPLIFMKGIAGALFFDQAVAVSVGLFVSLIVSITILPVLYRLIYRNKRQEFLRKKTPKYYYWYDSLLKMTLRNPVKVLLVAGIMTTTAFIFYRFLPVTRFPEISTDEIVLKLEWNQPVTLQENNLRISRMLNSISPKPEYVVEEAGRQQYFLQTDKSGSSENQLFIKASSPAELKNHMTRFSEFLRSAYPDCDFTFEETDHLLNLSFGKTETPLEVQFAPFHPGENDYPDQLTEIQKTMEAAFPRQVKSKLVTRALVLLETDPEKMVLHQIGYQELLHEIKRVLDVSTIISVNNHEMLVPVKIGNGKSSLFQTIHQTQIINNNGEQIPLAGLVKINHGSGLRSITAGMDGEYFPVWLDIPSDKFSSVTSKIRSLFKKNDRFNLGFSGEIQENNQMIRELLVIITISVLLLYFILAAQFESLVLPLIVLIEIPLDLFGAFLFLQVFNQGINIMSGIGVIVMSGIIVNDSILKIDTINKLYIRGFSLLRSISEAGKRRLKPILMTSITTILAMVPILFQEGMAAELQYPLALTIIGGMTLGTLVSLFIIPLLYLLIKKRNWVKNQKPPLREIYHG